MSDTESYEHARPIAFDARRPRGVWHINAPPGYAECFECEAGELRIASHQWRKLVDVMTRCENYKARMRATEVVLVAVLAFVLGVMAVMGMR